MADPLWTLTIAQLGELFRRGATTPSDALEAVLARLHAVNPRLNAVVALAEEPARQAARESTQRWASGTQRGALDGIPFTVKDNIPTAGMPTSWGSAAYRAIAPAGDELPIARLRAAGAVPFGKTNVPEFTSQGYTANALYGVTRNPWNLALTPGGSSGGAVAAVASGIGPFAIGTDGGGSIRRPASHAGLFGLKPSRGRVARCDGLPAILLDYETIGPIARSLADIEAVTAVIAVADARDPASLAMAEFCVPPWRACRILYVPRFDPHPVDPEIAASTDAVAAALAADGHAVERGAAPFDVDGAARIQATVSQSGLAWLERDFAVAPVSEALREMAAAGKALPAAALFAALDDAQALRARMLAFFAAYDLLLTPAAAALPWPAEETHQSVIAGEAVGPRGHAVFTAFANITGLPGLAVPGPRSVQGLPIGAQLVGPHGADGLLLAIAGRLEGRFPGAPAIADLG